MDQIFPLARIRADSPKRAPSGPVHGAAEPRRCSRECALLSDGLGKPCTLIAAPSSNSVSSDISSRI
jgi:hypothetical protein